MGLMWKDPKESLPTKGKRKLRNTVNISRVFQYLVTQLTQLYPRSEYHCVPVAWFRCVIPGECEVTFHPHRLVLPLNHIAILDRLCVLT